MARRKKVTSKQCAMTGMTFPTNEFYARITIQKMDYTHTVKKLITFRRRLQATGASIGTTELRTMFNNLFQTAV